MENNQKDCKIIFRIEESLLKDYKSLCDSQGWDMSKRLRKFIDYELKYAKNNQNIINRLDNYIILI